MKKKETRVFQSETKQILQIMINSLYSNKEIFLRELISNAADANDKLRFFAISNPDLYEKDNELKIRISVNKDQNTLTISDNGIGMTRDEVIKNLGTIAHSGTKSFLKKFNEDINKNNLGTIGQFGVGFYSSFIVAKKVIVHTRSANKNINEGVYWESKGEENYIIDNYTKKTRGTDVILYLRENEKELFDTWKLRDIINKYSDHINTPVEIKLYDKKNNTNYWEQVNKAQAIWIRKKSDIKDHEYKEFYKYITHDFNDPLMWSHNIVEGKQSYTCLLYIPSSAPFDLWNHKYKHGLKLYVQRVFIMDKAEQFMPNYLRFVRGIIDSSDLSLNISREILQDNIIIKQLRNSLVNKIFALLEKAAINEKEKYQKFWNEFGLVFKEGPAEDKNNLNKISNLLRFSSTFQSTNEQTISLKDYVNRMPAIQDKIYYITADNYLAAKNSPHLEIFNIKNIEVLLLYDRIDEWMMNYLSEFEGKKFQLISKSDVTLNNLIKNEKDDDIQKNKLDELIKNIKNVLGSKVKDVKITFKLINTPAIVTTESNDMSTQMAKLLSAAGQNINNLKYLFEINPKHQIIKNIANMHEKDQSDWVELLFNQALLIEKGTLEDNISFVNLINKLLIKK